MQFKGELCCYPRRTRHNPVLGIMAQRVRPGMFDDSGPYYGLPHFVLQHILTHVVTPNSPGARIHRRVLRGKDILPPPFIGGLRIFHGERVRQLDVAMFFC